VQTSRAQRAPMPPAYIASLAGLAMLRALQTAFVASFHERSTLGALICFLTRASDAMIDGECFATSLTRIGVSSALRNAIVRGCMRADSGSVALPWPDVQRQAATRGLVRAGR